MQIHDYRRIYGKIGDAYAQFEISEEDPLGAGTVQAGHTFEFYGYLSSDGAWIIQRGDTTTASKLVAWRYVGGSSGYAAAWAGRDALTYELYNLVTIP